jgi:hypothetical protein
MYHDRTEWRCALKKEKKYGSKGYPQRNAAHMVITEMKSVYNEVRTGSLNKTVCASSLKG